MPRQPLPRCFRYPYPHLNPRCTLPAIYGFTHQNPDGNRYLKGQAGLPNAQTLDIKLAGTRPDGWWRPPWAVGVSGSWFSKTARLWHF
ncbi:MAG: hypothetical protein OSB75_12790 [Dehalococcoidia bacterium]|nr:hypothetical protein [Dehalococcoidia bacterium]